MSSHLYHAGCKVIGGVGYVLSKCCPAKVRPGSAVTSGANNSKNTTTRDGRPASDVEQDFVDAPQGVLAYSKARQEMLEKELNQAHNMLIEIKSKLHFSQDDKPAQPTLNAKDNSKQEKIKNKDGDKDRKETSNIAVTSTDDFPLEAERKAMNATTKSATTSSNGKSPEKLSSKVRTHVDQDAESRCTSPKLSSQSAQAKVPLVERANKTKKNGSNDRTESVLPKGSLKRNDKRTTCQDMNTPAEALRETSFNRQKVGRKLAPHLFKRLNLTKKSAGDTSECQSSFDLGGRMRKQVSKHYLEETDAALENISTETDLGNETPAVSNETIEEEVLEENLTYWPQEYENQAQLQDTESESLDWNALLLAKSRKEFAAKSGEQIEIIDAAPKAGATSPPSSDPPTSARSKVNPKSAGRKYECGDARISKNRKESQAKQQREEIVAKQGMPKREVQLGKLELFKLRQGYRPKFRKTDTSSSILERPATADGQTRPTTDDRDVVEKIVSPSINRSPNDSTSKTTVPLVERVNKTKINGSNDRTDGFVPKGSLKRNDIPTTCQDINTPAEALRETSFNRQKMGRKLAPHLFKRLNLKKKSAGDTSECQSSSDFGGRMRKQVSKHYLEETDAALENISTETDLGNETPAVSNETIEEEVLEENLTHWPQEYENKAQLRDTESESLDGNALLLAKSRKDFAAESEEQIEIIDAAPKAGATSPPSSDPPTSARSMAPMDITILKPFSPQSKGNPSKAQHLQGIDEQNLGSGSTDMHKRKPPKVNCRTKGSISNLRRSLPEDAAPVVVTMSREKSPFENTKKLQAEHHMNSPNSNQDNPKSAGSKDECGDTRISKNRKGSQAKQQREEIIANQRRPKREVQYNKLELFKLRNGYRFTFRKTGSSSSILERPATADGLTRPTTDDRYVVEKIVPPSMNRSPNDSSSKIFLSDLESTYFSEDNPDDTASEPPECVPRSSTVSSTPPPKGKCLPMPRKVKRPLAAWPGLQKIRATPTLLSTS